MNDLFFHGMYSLLDHVKKTSHTITCGLKPIQVGNVPHNVFCNSDRTYDYWNNKMDMQYSFKVDGCFHDI